MEEINDSQGVVLDNDDSGAVVADKKEETPEPSAREKELEAEAAKWKRIATRKAKKAGLESSDEEEVDSEPEPAVKKLDDLGYGEKAFLNSRLSVKGADELQLVKDFMKRTGDSLDSLVEDDIFLAKLGKLREAKAAAEAVPKGKGRSSQPASDDVDYWKGKIDSGQATLNDIQNVEVRRKVLNLRIEHEKTGSRFSDNPIQMNV
jgi:hypothetical protein